MFKKMISKALLVIILFSTIMTSTVYAGENDVPRAFKISKPITITMEVK